MFKTLSEPGLAELSDEAWQLIERADLVVADLDGCLAADNVPLPGAMHLVQKVIDKLVVASNNSTHSAAQLSALLQRNSLPIPAGRLVLAGELAVRIVAEQHPGARVMLLGTAAIREAAARAGLRLVDQDAEVVLLARALDTRFGQWESAVAALHAGASLVVTNPDLSHPGLHGEPRIETGALFAMFKAVLPALQALVVGKPEPAMFQAALALGGACAERSLMIGDNPATDIEGARRLGLQTIHLSVTHSLKSALKMPALAN